MKLATLKHVVRVKQRKASLRLVRRSESTRTQNERGEKQENRSERVTTYAEFEGDISGQIWPFQ